MIRPVQVPAYVLGLLTRVPVQRRKISVLNWLKAEGEFVTEGEAIIVLDTRKATVEMVAEASGLLFHLIEPNEKVNVGDVLGVLADSVEEFNEYRKRNPIDNVA